MDMLKKIKSLFVVEDEHAPAPITNTTETPVSNVSGEFSAPVADTMPSAETNKTVDPKFIDILMKAIEENNLEGFDYLEFKSSLQSLSKMNMDDATRYQSAMAMAKTLGANPDKILQSANHYLSILKAESDKFQQAVEAQKSKLNQDQVSGVKALEQAIAAKEQQILQLNKEIEADKQRLSKMQTDIQQGAAKISDTSNRFNQAYNLVKKQINDDVALISAHASKV